ncbi:DMT family transporter [Avibacterium paragallinarum]|uniref:DMT family transporter n=1 Tax=Avibacterium paragallinarum TaxID=728 RepID=A0ABU7QQS4_AVIPA|nr:DMT family transporter [Avibacterium paragallinarum]
MHYLFLAIACSVAVSVLLKVARKFNVVIEQAIAFNYLIALLLSYFLLQPNFQGQGFTDFIVQNENSAIFLSLGLLLPSVFIIMSKAVEFAGIVRSDAAQRLSLFLPILAAFVLFGEQLSQSRIISLILAFSALFCLINKPREQGLSVKGGLSLLAVWFGYGVIDILFKQTAKMGSAFPTTLFIAFALAMCVMFMYLLIKRTQWNGASLLAGIVLGGLNFMNILFYIRAHQSFSQNPTLVFAGMNIGVICLGTLVGAIVFKEKISKINGVGVVLGISAILSLFYLEPFLIR